MTHDPTYRQIISITDRIQQRKEKAEELRVLMESLYIYEKFLSDLYMRKQMLDQEILMTQQIIKLIEGEI